MKDLVLTDPAIAHFSHLLETHPDDHGLLFQVLNKGCSGMKYDIVVGPIQKEWVPIHEDKKIYVHPDSIDVLKNVFVDLKQLPLDQSKVIFLNANAKNACGCGESFNLDE